MVCEAALRPLLDLSQRCTEARTGQYPYEPDYAEFEGSAERLRRNLTRVAEEVDAAFTCTTTPMDPTPCITSLKCDPVTVGPGRNTPPNLIGASPTEHSRAI
jgi:hypothetical protein